MRPTPEQVVMASRLTEAGTDFSTPDEMHGHALVLAAEVRALQSELQLFREASEAAELRIVELRAELEALKLDRTTGS